MKPAILFADMNFGAEQVGEHWCGEELLAWAVGDDTAFLHEDDALDFWEDVAEVVGDEDEAGAFADEAAEAFAEVALGGQVQGVGGFV